MGKLTSIAFFVLIAEAYQFYLYYFLSAHDLARVGLLGPLAGALVGAAVASLAEQFWRQLSRFTRIIIYASIVVLFIGGGTTYYQCYAEQITYDARILHSLAPYTTGPWGSNPWMMYPSFGRDGFGSGCQYLWSDVGATVFATAATSFVWLPAVALIAWLTTRPQARAREVDASEVIAA